MSELSAAERAVLDALWALRPAAPARVQQARERAAALGCSRSTSTIRQALRRLVDEGYATQLNIRHGEHGPVRAEYLPKRRYSETPPAVCADSPFLMWLWEARMDWRLWKLAIGERMVWVDNWGMRATAQEWSWLASRPALVADGQPTPDGSAWWEDA